MKYHSDNELEAGPFTRVYMYIYMYIEGSNIRGPFQF